MLTFVMTKRRKGKIILNFEIFCGDWVIHFFIHLRFFLNC